MEIRKESQKRGWRQFALGMVLYAVVITATSLFSNRLELPQVLNVVLALLPMILAVWAMLGWIRAVRSFGELQQRILGEGLYWALGLTSALTFSYGLLEAYAELPKVSMLYVWPLINVTFIVGQALARRRYR